MDNNEIFWNADLKVLKKGYLEKDDCFICLLCGKEVEKGVIFSVGENLLDSEKCMKHHISNEHNSVFDYLINLDKKLTGLSEHQKMLLKLFYSGISDRQILQETKIGSASTIRNHRFILKEKERQAKIFLVLMDLLKEKDKSGIDFVDLPRTAKMIDDRYNITLEEKEKILKKYFPNGVNGSLKTFNIKEKYKFIVLCEIAKKFNASVDYKEKEINEIIKAIYYDYVTVRRYLIEYGFLDRKPDGSSYWLK